ncbi:hypothetical protein HNP38_000012 [Chryseobacterium defluvii]|uniref:Uncharacterized protein n=1 Tax=Chryseobacterium defluvii TaxID=160396 RepID=A0A840KAW3_9FLAO|nr:hypothetical protein [Chryseobacterium defluvii]MBB4804740.1 hypothetical protein [Chryseobacterium defluvii]
MALEMNVIRDFEIENQKFRSCFSLTGGDLEPPKQWTNVTGSFKVDAISQHDNSENTILNINLPDSFLLERMEYDRILDNHNDSWKYSPYPLVPPGKDYFLIWNFLNRDMYVLNGSEMLGLVHLDRIGGNRTIEEYKFVESEYLILRLREYGFDDYWRDCIVLLNFDAEKSGLKFNIFIADTYDFYDLDQISSETIKEIFKN